MKIITLALALIVSAQTIAQTKPTAEQIALAEKLIDLTFTETERDSMLDKVAENFQVLKAIHSQHLDNWVPPVVSFDPLPNGKIVSERLLNKSVKMPNRAVAWEIPPSVTLPKNRADLAFYSIRQLASLIKNKKITSVELTQFFINRLKQYGDTLHCVISLTETQAMTQAHRADAELAKGTYRGILHGIPYGIKDLLAVKGTLTTWGAAPYKNQTIDQTATVVSKLEAAGAVMVAKLTLGSLAWGDIWYGGRTRNPWDLERGSSGSSAGSASAVVAGLVPFTIGSETLGSIVSPSTQCGATGLRPTFGRVSRYGAMTLCWTLDKLGPIVRCADDAAIVLDIIRGSDGLDKTVKDYPFSYTGKGSLKGKSIGFPKNIFDTLNKNRNEWRVFEALEKAGARLLPFEFKTSVPHRIVDIVLMAESAAAFDELTRLNIDDQLTVQIKNAWPNFFRAARFLPAVDYINANRLRTRMIEEIDALISPFDAVLTTNFDANQLAITNLTGHPAIAMPSGFRNGQPTSVTFLGNYFDEATLLTIAKLVQDITDFEDKHPAMFEK